MSVFFVKRNISAWLLAVVFGLLNMPLVYAQNTQANSAVINTAPSSQSEQSITLPVSSREVLPRLPISKLCTKDKIIGVWKLAMLYEVPAGREMKSYVTHPLQYFVFESDSRSGEYRSIIRNINLHQIRDLVMGNIDVVRQFTVAESGMIFFYKNSVAVDSLACFIVDSGTPPFRVGQMLLMPPERAAAGVRMLRVYERAYLEFESKP